MYVPDELKVNKFIDVRMPDNKSLFGRFGQVSIASGMYTGDEVAHIEQNKTEELLMYQRYAERMASEQSHSDSGND